MERLMHRSFLPPKVQAVYDQLLAPVARHERAVFLGDSFTKKQLIKAYESILFDYPQLFLHRFAFANGRNFTLFQPDYWYESHESIELRRQMVDGVERMVQELRLERLPVLERLQAICRWFRENVHYDETQKGCYTAVSALVPPYRSVCQGIALALRVVCARVGIECAVVVGSDTPAEEECSHAWNIVEIGGIRGHIDLTFDLQRENTPAYFMLSDQTMRTERWFPQETPRCQGLPLKENLFQHMKTADEFCSALALGKPNSCMRVKASFLFGHSDKEEILQEMVNDCTPDSVQTYAVRLLNDTDNSALIRLS